MKKIFLHAFYFFLAIFPSRLKCFVYNQFLGCEIHRTARIGFSLILAKKIVMGPHACIKHFNIIRNLDCLELGEAALIGNFNRVTCLPWGATRHFQMEENRRQALVLGRHAAIVGRHFFDCNNAILIGEYALIAGAGSSVFTHGINIQHNRQESGPVTIGKYCMIGAHSVILKNASLPDYSVLAANSTLHKAYTQTHTLYSGVPAVPVKALDPESKFFHRKEGYVA